MNMELALLFITSNLFTDLSRFALVSTHEAPSSGLKNQITINL